MKIYKIIILIIFDKTDNFIGVISLSSINFEKSSADIALILNQDKKIGPVAKNFLSSLEAIALMTEHAFENLGLQRIAAGQSAELDKWQNLMEITGYKIEGINKNKFVKGLKRKNVMMISCSINDYLYLKNKTFLNAHLIKHGFVDVDTSFSYKNQKKFLKLQMQP